MPATEEVFNLLVLQPIINSGEGGHNVPLRLKNIVGMPHKSQESIILTNTVLL